MPSTLTSIRLNKEKYGRKTSPFPSNCADKFQASKNSRDQCYQNYYSATNETVKFGWILILDLNQLLLKTQAVIKVI